MTLEFAQGGIFEELEESGTLEGARLIQAARSAARHPVFRMLDSVESVRAYMYFHVWCVWDFMSLAKAVQLAIGCYRVPWTPPNDPSALAIINAILLNEETDEGPDGQSRSHLEIYLDAMREAGAKTGKFKAFLTEVDRGVDVEHALASSAVERGTVDFVRSSLRLAQCAPHVACAAFCLGREELLPSLTLPILAVVPRDTPCLGLFRWYMARHVELDSGSHGPQSATLLRRLISGDRRRLQEAITAGHEAISARVAYLDFIAEKLLC